MENGREHSYISRKRQANRDHEQKKALQGNIDIPFKDSTHEVGREWGGQNKNSKRVKSIQWMGKTHQKVGKINREYADAMIEKLCLLYCHPYQFIPW